MSKLFSTTCIPQSAEYILTGARRRFTRQEDGSATVFAVVTLLLLLLVGASGLT
ncbi:hypothetical protein [Sulfitobacter albidus]|uniref:hypothetical protein n=1 Tax=Sulfitobacter albidus TaxID=2829501 RepID=UPI0020C8BF03|nr:hypothetical protein [Sulfitobacter albidus]